MTHPEAISRLEAIKQQLEKLIVKTSRKHWTDRGKASVVAEFRAEIEALDYAISMLSSQDQLRKINSDVAAQPGWDHFDTTPIDPTVQAAGRPRTRR